MLWFKKKKVVPEQKVPFSDYDRTVIYAVAAGDKTKVQEAVSIFRSVLRGKQPFYHDDPYFAFMSEVDNKCPCWVLISQNRAKILGKEWLGK